MIRAASKRTGRGSTTDRASVDTNASIASSGASSSHEQAKRLKKDDVDMERSGSLVSVSKDSQPPSPNSLDLVEELFTAVVQHTDDKGRQISAEFALLPSHKEHQEYYAAINNPVDLKQVAIKIQKGAYSNLEALVGDLLLMVDNALDFNKVASPLHKDAALMKKFVMSKRNEYEQRELHRTTERTVRTRRLVAQTTQPLSAVYAALEYGDEETAMANVSVAEGEEDIAMEADSDEESHDTAPSISGHQKHDKDDQKSVAMYQLWDAVIKLKGPAARLMSTPFMKLPSKRKYKDYYDVIHNPVSLTNIRTKLKNGLYLALDEMILDLQLMCQNAQKFNEGTSGIYRDSVRIAKFVESQQKEYLAVVDKRSTAFRTSLSERLLPEYDDSAGRRRAKFIVRSILECQNTDSYPAEVFLEKPSKKEYKDYYIVIVNPIDLKTIVNKVIGDKYVNEEALMDDLKLMCSNAKVYNREDSDIHRDAIVFEEVVKKATKTMNVCCPLEAAELSGGHSPVRRSTSSTRRSHQSFRAPTTALQGTLMQLYDYVLQYSTGQADSQRYLATHFQTLPLKTELPTYYEVIKKPVDLDKIHQRIQNEQYGSLEEAIDDFGQMFENAAAFNEPTSDIYRDALVLLNAVMEKAKEHMTEVVPHVQHKVQEILRALMDSVMTCQKEGRYLSDTLADCTFSDSDSRSGSEASRDSAPSSSVALTLDSVKANVEGGRYRRLDRFQDDVFAVLEKARFTAQPDSIIYEDAVQLHLCFIHKRDELCGPSGEKLFTPALQFTLGQFQSSIDMERKQAKWQPTSSSSSSSSSSSTTQVPAVTTGASTAGPCVMGANGEAFFIGDFVYLAPEQADGSQPRIVCIQDIVTGEGGALQLRGCYMLRPAQTSHQPARRFYDKEVLESEWVESHAPTRIVGRCFVLQSKDYFKMAPAVALADGRDVYICDTSYNVKTQTFKKIKKWKLPVNERVQLVKRERPVVATRSSLNTVTEVASTSKAEDPLDVDGQKTSSDKLCPPDQVIDVVREMVLARSAVPQDGHLLYEQRATAHGYIKLGDCFSIRKDDKELHIIKIDKIFDKEEVTFVSGSIFLFTKDIPAHLLLPAKLFYDNEVFQKVTEIEEAWPVTLLGPRCAVLTLRDFTTCRPTEIAPQRIFIVESKLLDNGQLAKVNKGKRLLNVSHTGLSHATDDEVLFFDKHIQPHKVVSPTLQAALSGKLVEVDGTAEESGLDVEEDDMTNASEITDQTALSPVASTVDLGRVTRKRRRPAGSGTADGGVTPSSVKRSPAKKTKYTVSGFILYGAENRKTIRDQLPNLSFQDTSRHVSDMWKNLPEAERKRWEEMARRKSNFVNTELRSRGLQSGQTFKGLGSMDESAIVAELEKRLLLQDSMNKANAELANRTAKEVATLSSLTPSTSSSSTAALPSTAYTINTQTIALLQAQQAHFQRQLQVQQQQFQQERQAQQRSLFLTLPTEPPKVKKALHTSVFLKYLEENGMSGSSGQKPAVPSWRRQMTASPHNTAPPQHVADFWPTLLNIDAESKNKGMEVISRMWSTRNMILSKTCALQPATLLTAASFSTQHQSAHLISHNAQATSSATSSTQPLLVPSPPPILSRSNSAKKATSRR